MIYWDRTDIEAVKKAFEKNGIKLHKTGFAAVGNFYMSSHETIGQLASALEEIDRLGYKFESHLRQDEVEYRISRK